MTKASRIALKIFSGFITALLIIIIIANSYILLSRKITGNRNVTVLGFSWAVVLTGSMADTIEPNDMIITRAQDKYSVGDIVMFEGEASTVTHRIIEITDRGYLTKGDANNTHDGAPILPEKVIGRVVHILPRIGSVIAFLSTPLGMLSLVFVLILLVEIPNLISKKSKRGETDEEKSA